ncbi:MAG: phage/plasmid primase, P4 family [archaeon]
MDDSKKKIIEILGNDGELKKISRGQYFSYKNNGFIKKNSAGDEFLDIYEESKSPEFDLDDYLREGKFGVYVDIDTFSKYLSHRYYFKTVYGKKSEEIFVYNNGIYHEGGRELIETESERLLGTHAKSHVISEVFKKIKRLTAISKKDFESVPLKLIPFANCVYNIQNDEVFEYSPEFYFRFKVLVDYIKTANCKKFEKFIKQVLSPEDIPAIQEWFGFCFYRKYFIKKGMIWVGERDTGKTILLSLLIRLVGEDNVSGISLQRLSGFDKFAPSALYEKLLNTYDDLSSRDINDTGGFKIATGGGYVTAEKKFGDSFQFINFAKLTFACNKIPPIKDVDDEAYYFRWIPIEFLNQVPENEQDKFLLEKLTTPEELSGILNWSLVGLKRLLKNGRFSYIKSVEETKRIIDRSGNPLAGFVQDCLVKEDDSRITKEVMYEIYSLWCKNKKITRMSKEALGRQLEKHAEFIIAKRDKERYWQGATINLKPGVLPNDTLDGFRKILEQQDLVVLTEKDMGKKVSKVSKTPIYQKNLNSDDTFDAFKAHGAQQNNKTTLSTLSNPIGRKNNNVEEEVCVICNKPAQYVGLGKYYCEECYGGEYANLVKELEEAQQQ